MEPLSRSGALCERNILRAYTSTGVFHLLQSAIPYSTIIAVFESPLGRLFWLLDTLFNPTPRQYQYDTIVVIVDFGFGFVSLIQRSVSHTTDKCK